MIHQPATTHQLPSPRKTFVGLTFLILLASFLASPPPVAGASGSVSLTIRVEVGPSDLPGGGLSGDLEGAAGAEQAVARFASSLRRSLEDRYLPSEIDRIVDSVAGHAVVVIDGEAVAANPADSLWLDSDNGNVVIL